MLRQGLHFVSTIAGRMLLTALALGSLTVMLLVVGGVVAVSAGGQQQSATRPRVVRIRQLAPLTTPTLAATGPLRVPVGGWEVTVVQFPTSTPVLTPTALATPLPTGVPVAMSTPPAHPKPVFSGWPTGGQVTQGFGCSPYYSGIPAADCSDAAPWFHDGVDIANLDGAPVRAALAGTVVFAGPDTAGPVCGPYQGYGLSVIIDGGQGRRALYAHLSKLEVTTGQPVNSATLIGAVGATGCASGPHLHLGLQIDGQVVDPALYIKDEG